MDTDRTMIVIDGKPCSSKIESCDLNDNTNKYDIRYKKVEKTYHYNVGRVLVLKTPTIFDPQGYQVRHNGRLLSNISSIYVYENNGTEYWRICCSSGKELECNRNELEIDESVLENDEAKRVLEYLREIADNVGPGTEVPDHEGTVDNEDGRSFLAKQYEKIDFVGKQTAASIYLNPNEFQINTDVDVSALIFPFGCNESQYHAVLNALSNRISVIEGPPGTGKTQTILNIIANLIIQEKTIQIVSNNNSAIDNVIEKLSSYGMGFIVAQLGNKERVAKFIECQTCLYPDELSTWGSGKYDSPEFMSDLNAKLECLREIFRNMNLLAKLRQKLYQVRLEQKYYENMVPNPLPDIFRKSLTSESLLEFWQEYQDIHDGKIKTGIIYQILYYFATGARPAQILKWKPSDLLNKIQGLYYDAEINEIESEIADLEEKLLGVDELLKEFTDMSLKCFRAVLAKRYGGKEERKKFDKNDLWTKYRDFQKEYPVVLSTTYTARSSLGKYSQFDYIIMDEASQVDVVAGTLAVSCARNAVIVGDTKQLPNVVTSKQKEQLDSIFHKYNIHEAYNYSENSFLKSLCILLEGKIPKRILCEHYRCHPQIIGFCNEKFYHGDLVVMTPQDHHPALQLITTDVGAQEFNHTNMNQFEAIRGEILSEFQDSKGRIGIIAPYKNQVHMLVERLEEPEIDIATVHKFQGREKDAIILSTVDDTVTEFSDDSNLLNVAISRAKKKLVVVTSNREQPIGSNIGDLIGYIRYNNCDAQHNEIRPVFKYFYDKSAESRHRYLEKHGRVSEWNNENKTYEMILEELDRREKAALGVVCHQHLNRLFQDLSKMSEEERRYINAGLPQLDFLIFNRVTRLPLLAVTVEHDQCHTENLEKTERDSFINHILKAYGIPLLQLSGDGGSDKEELNKELDAILRPKRNYTLVITEKPSVARAYAKVLGALNKKYKYLEGNGYLISWCYGHLVELVEPDGYDEKYITWNIEDLPIIPKQWKYQTKGKNKEQFDILKQLMNRDDVTNILCATDAGREGELIFRLVYQQAKCEKPFQRIWISSMEKSAIKEAFANPRPASDYDSVYEAARSRQLADWIVGMNATRRFTCLYKKYYGKPLRVGRVVSPTMAMIVDREKEIKAFVPKSHYIIKLNVGGAIFESRRLDTEEEALQVEHKCRKAISDNA